MAIFWRYLLSQYVKVFFLSVLSFIAILLVSRLEEIAHFASIGAPLATLGCFALLQIPYVLPIAIPISSLISAMILFQNLSHTLELTALRAGGIPLRQILAPVMIASCFLSLGNFYISSELATSSHLTAKEMLHNLTSLNPLILLQNANIAKLQGAYVQMDPVRNGEAVKDVVIALKGTKRERFSLLLAKKISMAGEDLIGEEVTFITALPFSNTNCYTHRDSRIGSFESPGATDLSPSASPISGGDMGDADGLKDGDAGADKNPILELRCVSDNLFVENQAFAKCSAPSFSHFLQKDGWKIANDNLRFSLLRLRAGKIKRENGPGFPSTLQKCYSEISRRICLGIAPLTFTLMGIAFGMEISRERSKRGIITVLIMAGLSLMAFFAAKELDHLFLISSSLFFLPHFFIATSALFWMRRINRGIE